MKKYILILIILLYFLLPSISLAQSESLLKKEISNQTNTALGQTGLSFKTDPRIIVARIINNILTVIGIILIVLMVYAGFLWMTAHGDTDQLKKAKDTLRNAAIGLLIVVLSYSMVTFVIRRLELATTKDYFQGDLHK